MAPAHNNRTAPKRSATPPANGRPTPHSRVSKALPSEDTSRPPLPATDSGVRNWPIAERGPKLSKAMRQPQPTTKAGVRQLLRACKVMDINVSPKQDGEWRGGANIGAQVASPK